MRKRQKLFVPTAAQAETAGRLSAAIAPLDFGYDIVDLKRYGNTPFDFLAVHRSTPTRVIAVVLQPNGSISIRPFTQWGERNSLLRLIFDVKCSCRLRLWHKRYLPKSKEPGDWKHLAIN